jgi:hypothetical protein
MRLPYRFRAPLRTSVEAKAITSEPRGYENTGDASGEQRVNSFTGYCPRLFRRGGAIPDARCQSAYPDKDLLMLSALRR